MANVTTHWNMAAIGRAIGRAPSVVEDVTRVTNKIASSANSMSSGYRTGLYHRDHQSPAVGDTQPSYVADVREEHNSVVGIVYTGNYAAMKDNTENNTLLKAMG